MPDEVLFEASGFRDIAAIADLGYPLTASVAKELRRVMETVAPGDFDLLDLYHNRGNADPLLVAVALDPTAQSELTLLHEQWLVVTEDAAVRRAAANFGVGTLSFSEFVARLDT